MAHCSWPHPGYRISSGRALVTETSCPSGAQSSWIPQSDRVWQCSPLIQQLSQNKPCYTGLVSVVSNSVVCLLLSQRYTHKIKRCAWFFAVCAIKSILNMYIPVGNGSKVRFLRHSFFLLFSLHHFIKWKQSFHCAELLFSKPMLKTALSGALPTTEPPAPHHLPPSVFLWELDNKTHWVHTHHIQVGSAITTD